MGKIKITACGSIFMGRKNISSKNGIHGARGPLVEKTAVIQQLKAVSGPSLHNTVYFAPRLGIDGVQSVPKACNAFSFLNFPNDKLRCAVRIDLLHGIANTRESFGRIFGFAAFQHTDKTFHLGR